MLRQRNHRVRHRQRRPRNISRNGGPIKAPDDIAFDSKGLLYVTEFLNARVSTMTPEGKAEVLIANVPGANGITDLSRSDLHGRMPSRGARGGTVSRWPPPKVLVQGLDLANALSVGPDGMLYFPQLAKGEVCRVSPDGGPWSASSTVWRCRPRSSSTITGICW